MLHYAVLGRKVLPVLCCALYYVYWECYRQTRGDGMSVIVVIGIEGFAVANVEGWRIVNIEGL